MSRRKLPRKITLRAGYTKGIEAVLNVNPGDEIAEGSFWTYNPRELRRLAAWCLQAAEWLETRKIR